MEAFFNKWAKDEQEQQQLRPQEYTLDSYAHIDENGALVDPLLAL